MTLRLYYDSAYIRSFESRVLSCAAVEGGWEVITEATAFFPGGGGQAADGGTLGGAAVLDCFERGDDVVHVCAAALPAGGSVRGELDWATRFSRMQQHSGEHVLSGTAHRLFGCENVGFHMGGDGMVIDFSRELSEGDVLRLEDEANAALWRDAPIRCFFPSPEELPALNYRSKKELTGPVRLVEVEGIDLCACCAPHLSSTGQAGVIKIIESLRHRGGTRLRVKCGGEALRDARLRYESVRAVSEALSAPRDGIADYVKKTLSELEGARRQCEALRAGAVDERIRAMEPTEGNICVFLPDADEEGLRAVCNAGMALAGGVCAAFSGRDGDWRYVVGSERVDLRAASRAINAAIQGRGGGRPNMIQGSARASREAIEACFRREVRAQA